MPELPMFPLGTVLLPHMALPLHIFEPRYRAMITDVLAGEQRFGVTLITRGHEVGGGDVRSDVGTAAHVLQAEELDDGRWVVITVGQNRFRIERWLSEDPYPRAEVAWLPEACVGEQAMDLARGLEPTLRRVLTMLDDLGEGPVPPSFELSDDAAVACWQPAILAPVNAFDAQRVLVASTCHERLQLTGALLKELEQTLAFRLQGG